MASRSAETGKRKGAKPSNSSQNRIHNINNPGTRSRVPFFLSCEHLSWQNSLPIWNFGFRTFFGFRPSGFGFAGLERPLSFASWRAVLLQLHVRAGQVGSQFKSEFKVICRFLRLTQRAFAKSRQVKGLSMATAVLPASAFSGLTGFCYGLSGRFEQSP